MKIPVPKCVVLLLPMIAVWLVFYVGSFLPWDAANSGSGPGWWTLPYIITGITWLVLNTYWAFMLADRMEGQEHGDG